MLDPNSIYVWRVGFEASVSASDDQVEAWSKLLSVEEWQRANALRSDGPRRDYILAHAALRFVLAEGLGIPATAVGFQGGPSKENSEAATKPSLKAGIGDHSHRSDLRFNLSHTRGMALIGVALGREVGVDIEWQRFMEDLDPMALSVMSAEELALWQALAAGNRNRAFFKVWTRKEAYLKAIGLGLYHSLQSVTVPVTATPLDQAEIVADRTRADVWKVFDIPAPEGYSASVCWEGGEMPEIVVQDLNITQIA